MTALAQRVLVLNNGWAPIAVADVERAFGLLVSGAAKALDRNYQLFDFDSWRDLAVAYGGDDVRVRTAHAAFIVPKVLVLQTFDRVPVLPVRFSRNAIFMRDGFQCQYCGRHLRRQELNIDHVVPRAQGGVSSFRNCVAACYPCNTHKGSLTPDQAGMRLLREPTHPSGKDLMREMTAAGMSLRDWLPFLDAASAAYWCSTLEP